MSNHKKSEASILKPIDLKRQEHEFSDYFDKEIRYRQSYIWVPAKFNC